MNARVPEPDYRFDEEWRWTWWKFRMEPEALFTTLHNRFNTCTVSIQDPGAFHADVCECIDASATVEEFYANLEDRKAQRVEELRGAWDDIGCMLRTTPRLFDCARCQRGGRETSLEEDLLNDDGEDRAFAFSLLKKTATFDSVVMFFDGFVREERKRLDKRRARVRKNIDAMLERRRNRKKLALESNIPNTSNAASARDSGAVGDTAPTRTLESTGCGHPAAMIAATSIHEETSQKLAHGAPTPGHDPPIPDQESSTIPLSMSPNAQNHSKAPSSPPRTAFPTQSEATKRKTRAGDGKDDEECLQHVTTGKRPRLQNHSQGDDLTDSEVDPPTAPRAPGTVEAGASGWAAETADPGNRVGAEDRPHVPCGLSKSLEEGVPTGEPSNEPLSGNLPSLEIG